MPLPALIGAGASLLGSLGGLFGSKKPRIPTTQLNPFSFGGPGGAGGNYVPGRDGSGGALNLRYGDLDPIRQQFTGLAGMLGGEAMTAGIPPEVLMAAMRSQGAAGIPEFLQSALGGSMGMGMGGMGRAFTDLMGRQGAGSYDDVFSNTLGTLREQAAPFEQRQLQDMEQTLFNRGQLGAPGGGLAYEAFGRGLGQADLDRQLSARGEARNVMSLDDTLLGNAFARFGDTSRLFGDQISQGFGFNQAGFDRSQGLLGNQLQLAGLPGMLRGTALEQMLGALGGQGQLQSQLMAPMQFGLNAEQAAANARIGSQSNQVAYMNSPAYMMDRFGTSAALGQLGSALMGPGESVSSILSNLFNPGAGISDQWGNRASEELIRMTSGGGFGGGT